jgi:hypothetical protein
MDEASIIDNHTSIIDNRKGVPVSGTNREARTRAGYQVQVPIDDLVVSERRPSKFLIFCNLRPSFCGVCGRRAGVGARYQIQR